MRSHLTWFVLLVAACMLGPYLLHVRPRTPRQWTYLAITLSFLAWVLLFMVPAWSR